MNNDIKAIIFDFGGVIMDIDHQRVEEAFKQLGIDNFDELYGRAKQSEIFQKLEKGEISAREFRDGIREILGRNLSDDVIDYTWNQIIIGYPDHRIKLINQLRDNYKMYILSNTNVIHYHHYIFMFHDQYRYDFNTLFDNTFWSFKIGKRKPDRESFMHVFEKEDLDLHNTLFIDDTLKNIEAARKLNILATHLEPGKEVATLFEKGRLKPEIIAEARKM